MKINTSKTCLRALGIAESFRQDKPTSILAGVVMRGDLRIDGVALTTITLGGMDATEGIIRIYKTLNRRDINVIIIGGAVVSLFNIIDLEKIHTELTTPVISVTYQPSPGLEEHLRARYPERLTAYQKLGEREELKLKNGHTVFTRYQGLTKNETKTVLNRFTREGKRPEPVLAARLIARAVLTSKPGM